ncbi:MAG TPA: SusC/RagA family TonB-linked outer membrane protein [Crocinitomix sp.]|nr:SusC/RagA family TonB-linked outer membrane protein [Crocinitomix sp.]
MKTKINGILTLLLAFMLQMTFAQERTISGVVSDEMGPVADISVKVKGTTKGAVTDFDGNYTIKAKTGDTLEFTHVSYAAVEKVVGVSSKIDVTVKESGESLGEIVITGVAGKTNRKKLSVTVNKVSQKDLEFVPTSSASSVLQGKVAGVTVTNLGQPGDGANIQLRGATNLFGSQAPLIVVDGVIVEGGLADINSDDIASFEIVKGASASAMYGSRAGNGVVVISTKKGKPGKINVTFKSELGFSSINNFIDVNQSHHYVLANDWESVKGKYTKYQNVTYPADYNGSDYSQVDGNRVVDFDSYSDNPFGVYYNPQKDFFRTGNNNILFTSVSSGSEKLKLYFSAEKNDNKGVLRETEGYQRVAARLNAEIKINDWLKFNASNNYIRTNNHTPGGTTPGGSNNDIFFNLSLTDPDVNLNATNPDGQPYLFVPSRWNNTTTNPIYPLWANPELKKQNKFLGSYKFNIEFTDYLSLDTEYALEMITSKENDFTSLDNYRTGGTQAELFALKSTGNYYLYNYNKLSQKAQISLNFDKKYNDLGVKSKISYLIEDYQFDDFYGFGQNQIYPGVISLDNYDNAFIGSDSSSKTAKNIFAIVGLDYKDRYIVDGMYRVDKSSLFGENERTHAYYRFSGAYRISKDLNIDKIQELKLHVAIGNAGQRPGYNWQYPRIPISNGSLSTDRTKANPDLKPSTTTELEFGLNSSFLNRFDFGVVYSQASTEDQFMKVDIPSYINNGNNKQWQNIGTVEFNTIEANLNVKILKDTELKWNSGVIFDRTRNEITELNVSPITVGPTEGKMFRIEEGVEFGAMYGNKFVTTLDEMKNQLPTGASIDDFVVNRDGVVVARADIGTSNETPFHLLDENGDLFYGKIGKQTPDFKMGFNNSFSYKGFNFYTLVDWKKGGDIYNKNGQWLTRDFRHEMVDQSQYPDSEKKTIDYYQALYDTNIINEFWVEDGSYVKLREASLFYTINKDQLSNVAQGFFESIRVGVTGTNLFTITDYSGWDPEVQSYDTETLQSYSVDYKTYPINTTYTFSLMLKF